MVRTRFAPSPTGYLHIGGLRTALYAYLFAKANGGKFILRIEDTDVNREVEGAKKIIYRTLKDAGLVYDEGPDVGGEFGPYIQSQRKDLYLTYAKQLIANGGAYYCFCGNTQRDKTSPVKYNKHCAKLSQKEAARRVAAGEPYVIRQNVPLTGAGVYTDTVFGEIKVEYKDLSDGVLIKSDGMPTYNFANVIDDYLMNINYVIRGVEYLDQTALYNLIYQGLGWKIPHYIHLQPIMRDAQNKLSKRHGDASYEDFIQKGYLGEAIVNYIALLGWCPKDHREKLSLAEMIQAFSTDGLSKSCSIFDEDKMRWLNAQYIRELSSSEFYRRALPFLQQTPHLAGYDLQYAAELLHARCEVLSDVHKLTGFLSGFDNFNTDLFISEKWKTDKAAAKALLPELIALTQTSFDNLSNALADFSVQKGLKKGAVLLIYRIAITGAQITPGGAAEIANLLGKQNCLSRLTSTLNRL
ncbi:MAG: glutamate--tRNA ligase [Firmicutes bacterium]|nr:glutamate--tRNA ligase [Bacillota bacterium]